MLDARLTIRFTNEEREIIREMAGGDRGVSDFIRDCLYAMYPRIFEPEIERLVRHAKARMKGKVRYSALQQYCGD